MIEFSSFNMHRLTILMLMICLLYQNVNLSWSLNEEGLALLKFRERVFSDPFGALLNWSEEVGVIDPCSWSGVECANSNVVALNLKNLCLGGTMAPDIKNLVHLKSIILRNNSFSGNIPEEIGELKELEVLDLGYNNFSGRLPSDLGHNHSLTILLLDNNELFGSMSPEIDELKLLSEVQVDENQLSNSGQSSSGNARSTSWNTVDAGRITQRRLLKVDVADPLSDHQNNFPALFFSLLSSRRLSSLKSKSPSPSSPSSPSPSPSSSPSPSPSSSPSPSPSPSSLPNPKSPSTTVSVSPPSRSSPVGMSNKRALILSAAIGGNALVFLLAIGIYFCRSNKVSAVKPWATTGLSGQLQKAFVTGVPNLKRSELETACEDFSNVIGSSSMGTVYKGTSSSGVEIAVTSLAVESAKEWLENLESQFRKKIDLLSKVNHKNFVNLIGYCEEQEPFTRMMVFEYAPNGTLFEHLHIREAEHLDWGMRMRIAMGMAYCLEHMHQLKPPITHNNLNSSAVNLTEDYAAKISDFGLWNEFAATEMESNPESNIYSFGVVLFEMITGKLPYSVDSFLLQDWASDYLRGEQPLREMVDPMLKSFHVEQLDKFGEVIKSCCHPNPKQRPTMRDVTARVREITGIGFDEAVPKLSPLWWAELEILSTEAM